MKNNTKRKEMNPDFKFEIRHIMKAMYEITKIEFKLFLRLFPAVFFSFFFPSLMLLMFGGIYGNTPNNMFGGHGVVDVSFPAYTAMIIAVTGIMTLPLSVCGYREQKILKRYEATPISPWHVLASQIIINIIMTICGMILLFLVGKIVFNLHFLGALFPTIIALLLSIFSIFSIGILIASLSPNIKTAQIIANIVYFPMIFLTGATIPLEIFPKIMIKISKFIPLTYSVDLLKGVWLGGKLSDYTNDILILLIIMTISLLISIFTFRWE
ncbi:ABC transporter permease [Aceticella autotrophica]|uniref:Transport permease protein n=1 Tax=Aceticella autotrophica TaxID=2755338 RepID=A0A975AVF5_9THEO|nr:ABC transporter permease [Aceticella autotrophica]QSZ27199.1 ABC transporter permease [Aceticella autotrophica]